MFVIFIFREVRARAPPSANATGQKWPYRTLLGCVWGVSWTLNYLEGA